jgi:nucleoside triphosphate pyrophosphatase
MEKEPESQAKSRTGAAGSIISEPLVLASASPRRAEILRAVGWPFEKLAVSIDESIRQGEGAAPYVERLAREKAEAAAAQTGAGSLVLGADTTVVVGEEILAKPTDEEDARRMLRLLSGRWHEVLTGVALVRGGESGALRVAHERTRVRFAEMSEAEIDWYAGTGEPRDKAGAYAVQGRAALFIEEISGDYWNVVGLPIQLVYRLARTI